LNVKEGIKNKHIEIIHIRNILPCGQCILLIGTFLEIKTKVVFEKVFRILNVFMEKEYTKVQTLSKSKRLSKFFSFRVLSESVKLTHPSYPL